MPINKVGTKGITDGSVAVAEFADGAVPGAKLISPLDLSSKTITLPNTSVTNAQLAGSIANNKLSNSNFTLSGTSVSLGGSTSIPNKFVDWQSVITADGSTGTTGVSGRGYFINTTSAAHTFTLPVSATRGDNISIKDYAGTFATNNLTIARNGHNIQGVANNSLISTNRASVVLVYVDVTRGWEFVEESNVADLQGPVFITATGGTITTSGNFKIHSFTGDGCFVVSTVGNSPVVPTGGPSNVDYLVVAGGGGGGYDTGSASGGGGAGGYRTTFPSPGCNAGSFPITATSFPITVGAGGVSGPGGNPVAPSGSNSVFSTITSTGGAGGRSFGNGASGGSGSGAGSNFIATGAQFTGGTGNTPPVSPPQGNNGGTDYSSPAAVCRSGGGGGGSGGTGGNASVIPSGGNGGAGGNGSTNSITGSPVTYAGGGGGAGGPVAGTAGPGGGGTGAIYPSTVATAGTVNTGGGGGGGGTQPTNGGAAGGKGIVIIRYKFQ